jgi:hypothetical protein
LFRGAMIPLALLWASSALRAAETQVTVGAEVGHHLGAEFSSAGVTQERTYVCLTGESDFGDLLLSKTRFALNTDLNLWIERAQKTEVDVRGANLSWRTPPVAVTLGFQVIPWSHSLGIRIADVVNSRDWRDALYLDPHWIERGAFALNTEIKISPMTLQVIATPVPTQNRFPLEAHGIPVIAPNPFFLSGGGNDTEGGGRVSVQTEDHLNLGAFYYNHFNRNLILNSTTSRGSPAYAPVVQRTHSAGVGFTQNVDRWTIRGDQVIHFNYPYQSPSLESPHSTTFFQSVLGADYETRDEWILGMQHHLDLWESEQRHWLGGLVKRFWLQGQVITELFVLQGLNNPGLWWEPKVTWAFFKGWSLALALDYYQHWGDFNSNLLPLVGSGTRIFTWLNYQF